MRTVIHLALMLFSAVSILNAHVQVVQADDIATIVAKVKALHDKTSDATIKFLQTGAAGTMAGTLYYATGNKFRLELQGQTIVSDGKTTWTYVVARKQVLVSNASSGTGSLTPGQLLTAFPGNYKTELNGSTTVNKRAVWKVACTPQGGEMIGDATSATLYIDKKSYRLQQIDMQSATAGGTITVQVISARYNTSLPDAKFSFTAPEGATTIDLRR